MLHPDPNAAGSIFAWLIIAGLVIGARRRMWWLLAIACPMLVVAFLLAQSRSAVGAIALVVLARWLVPTLEKRSTWWPALGAVVVIAVVTVWMVASRSHIEPSQALSLRYEMARVGLRMAAAYPLYGVGVGDYARTSRRFLTPDQEALAVFARQGENAHNNFLQVIVEFGIPGGLAFVWLVCPAAIAAWRPSRPSLSPEYQGLALGLSAFLVSALLGHPLLIPEVAAMFFLGLGLTAASLDGPDEVSGRRQSLFAWGAVVFFVLSLFWRLG